MTRKSFILDWGRYQVLSRLYYHKLTGIQPASLLIENMIFGEVGLYNTLMCERKGWTVDEDQLLVQIMNQNENVGLHKKLKWNQIALRISQLGQHAPRKGKQCRQRWFNQLHPNINKQIGWSQLQQNLLFRLQFESGNHWAQIAKQLPGRSQNTIKNYFYSTLRKALRRVNNYVMSHKNQPGYKNIKAFQPNTLSKIIAVAQNKAEKKISICKQNANLLARDIKELLVAVQTAEKECEEEQNIQQLVSKIQDFNRICKRKKTKKRSQNRDVLENSLSLKNQQEYQQPLQSDSYQKSMKDQSKNHSLSQEQILFSHAQNQKVPHENSQLSRSNGIGLRNLSAKSLWQEQIIKVRQPIIPAPQNPNCQQSKNQLLQKSVDSSKEGRTTLTSSNYPQMKEEQTNQPNFLHLFPFVQTNYFNHYHGSAFMLTPNKNRQLFDFIPHHGFLPNPMIGEYPFSWSQDYTHPLNKDPILKKECSLNNNFNNKSGQKDNLRDQKNDI